VTQKTIIDSILLAIRIKLSESGLLSADVCGL